MTVAAASGGSRLVPITRAVLKQFYAQWPLEDVPEDECRRIGEQLVGLEASLTIQGSKTASTVRLEVPLRLDDCFWRSRQLCEEAAFSLEKVLKHLPKDSPHAEVLRTCVGKLLAAEKTVRDTQKSNTEAASAQVKQFLPQDFRGQLIVSRQVAGEAKYQKQVDDLIKRGGTIRDRYELYLKQQWERREALVQMGNLSGMYKMFVKYLGGIPSVLLDFAKEINQPEGPMEEQRLKYGPHFYAALGVGNALNVTTAVWAEALIGPTSSRNGSGGGQAPAYVTSQDIPACLAVCQPAVEFYTHHLTRVVTFLGRLFVKSPFFITQETAMSMTAAAPTASALDLDAHLTPIAGSHVAPGRSTAGGFTDDTDGVHCADALFAAVGLPHSHTHSSAPRRSSMSNNGTQAVGGDGHGKMSRMLGSMTKGRGTSTTGGGGPVDARRLPSQGGPQGVGVAAVLAGASVQRASYTGHGSGGEGPVELVRGHSLDHAAGMQRFPSGYNVHSAGGGLPRTVSAAESHDFYSCADNMSWVSNSQYQGSIIDASGIDPHVSDPGGVSGGCANLAARSAVMPPSVMVPGPLPSRISGQHMPTILSEGTSLAAMAGRRSMEGAPGGPAPAVKLGVTNDASPEGSQGSGNGITSDVQPMPGQPRRVSWLCGCFSARA